MIKSQISSVFFDISLQCPKFNTDGMGRKGEIDVIPSFPTGPNEAKEMARKTCDEKTGPRSQPKQCRHEAIKNVCRYFMHTEEIRTEFYFHPSFLLC